MSPQRRCMRRTAPAWPGSSSPFMTRAPVPQPRVQRSIESFPVREFVEPNGRSDGYSGLSASPVVGKVVDRLVSEAAASLRTPEAIGAEHSSRNVRLTPRPLTG